MLRQILRSTLVAIIAAVITAALAKLGVIDFAASTALTVAAMLGAAFHRTAVIGTH